MPAKATDNRRIVPLPLFWLPSTSNKLKPQIILNVVKEVLLYYGATTVKQKRGLMEIVMRGRTMSEEKTSREQVLQRVNELLDILKTISQDLTDVAKSLKAEVPVVTPALSPVEGKKRSIDDVRTLFPKDLEDMLLFEEKEEYIAIRPRQYLGSDNFAKIAAIARDEGGEYISAGKESHFRVPRKI